MMQTKHSPQKIFPSLIYGTAVRKETSSLRLADALSSGYRAIDTAANDLHDEAKIGEELSAWFQEESKSTADSGGCTVERNKLTLQCKYSPRVFFRRKSPPYNLEDPIALKVLKSFASTLTSLKLAHVDVFFLHRPLPMISQTFAAWEAMEEISRRGGATRLGISQVDKETLRELWERSDLKPSVVQNYFTSSNNYDYELRQFCKARGIVYQAFGVLGGHNHELLALEIVREMASKEGLSREAAFIALLFHAASLNGEAFCVLVGSSNKAHIEENFKAWTVAQHLDVDAMEDFQKRLFFCSGEEKEERGA